MQVLFETEMAIVTRESGFVRARRTSSPLVARPDAQKAAQDLVQVFRMAVPLRERKGLGLLIDTREAPLAMSDEAQDPIRPLIEEMMREFDRVAILVQSAVGLLQAVRRSRELPSVGHAAPQVFNDEAVAIAFLRGEEPVASSKVTGPKATTR